MRFIRKSGRLTHQQQVKFDTLMESAQSCFLKRKFTECVKFAGKALCIHHNPKVYALLSSAFDGMGRFDIALDMRFVLAMISSDSVLCQEVLGELMEREMFFKATALLRRLVALEKDPERYRSLQIQLSELYVAIGESSRAITILRGLWTDSKYRDFEIFARISSLYFQEERQNTLSRLIEESIENGFSRKPSALSNADVQSQDQSGQLPGERRSSKRVTFMETVMSDREAVATIANADAPSDVADETRVSLKHDEADDFSFNDPPGGASASQTSTDRLEDDDEPASVLRRLDLSTEMARRNFLTLINVQAELFNEQGRYAQCISLLKECAACLGVELMKLPPDLLLRYGVSCALIGQTSDSVEVFDTILTMYPIAEVSDVLYDAATTLQQVGTHEPAVRILRTVQRFHRLSCNADALREAEQEWRESVINCEGREHDIQCQLLALERQGGCDDETVRVEVAQLMEQLSLVTMEKNESAEQLQAVQNDIKEAALMDVACTAAIGKSLVTLFAASLSRSSPASSFLVVNDNKTTVERRFQEAEAELKQCLVIDPTHVESRLELCRLFMTAAEHSRGYRFTLTVSSSADSRRLTCDELRDAAIQFVKITDEDKLDDFRTAQLCAALIPALQIRQRHAEVASAGVMFANLLLPKKDAGDGDCLSVISGASRALTARGPTAGRRSSRSAMQVPKLNRSSSTLVSATSIVASQSTSAHTSRLSQATRSIAASYAAFSSASAVSQYTRRSSLATTVVGSQAAKSIAGGAADADGRSQKPWETKDTSALFSFHNKRNKGDASAPAKSARQQRRESRAEAVRRRREAFEAKYLSKAPPTDADAPTATNAPIEGGGEGAAGFDDNDVANLQDLDDMEAAAVGEGDVEEAQEEDTSSRVQRKRRRSDDGDDPDGDDGLLSIHDIAQRRFGDAPEVAAVFESCAAIAMEGGVAAAVALGGNTNTAHSSDMGTTTASTAAAAVAAPLDATPQQIVECIGYSTVTTLAASIADSYMVLGRFVEAKDFASVMLSALAAMRRRFVYTTQSLEAPLRLTILRAAVASGDSSDAAVAAMNLLPELQSDPQREAQVWQALASLVTSPEALADRRGGSLPVTAVLSRAVVGRGSRASAIVRQRPVPMLVLRGHLFLQRGSVRQALQLYVVALSYRPMCPYLHFLVSISFAMTSSNRLAAAASSDLVAAAVYYMDAYVTLVANACNPAADGEGEETRSSVDGDDTDSTFTEYFSDSHVASFMQRSGFEMFSGHAAQRNGPSAEAGELDSERKRQQRVRDLRLLEAIYNKARLMHYFQWYFAAVPLYEEVVKRSVDLITLWNASSQPPDEWLGRWRSSIEQVSRIQLYLLFKHVSHNPTLALAALDTTK